MGNPQRHRGAHPSDAKLFHERHHASLRSAVDDLCWLFSRGYAEASALEVVGNRYRLTDRQRKAVVRCSCSDVARDNRKAAEVSFGALANQHVFIDGYNLLITLETALSGGLLFQGRDGALRDLASLHGTYKKVEETLPAIHLAGKYLQLAGINQATWFLDAPVSNSGRLRSLFLGEASSRFWDWKVEVVMNPDKELIAADGIVITSDSWILDQAKAWMNLCEHIVQHEKPEATVLTL